jgi:large subunit ribosomal protein L23
MAHLEEIIIKPLITEKASMGSEKNNRFGFQVVAGANKHQIKMAVEKLYDVKVLNIKTNLTPGKLKRIGKGVKKTGKVKKAYVQLSPGQRIEFFKGI